MELFVVLSLFVALPTCGALGWHLAGPEHRMRGLVYGFCFGPIGLIIAFVLGQQEAEEEPPRERTMEENIALMAAIAAGERQPIRTAPPAHPPSSLADVPDQLTIRRNGEIIGTWPLADVLGYLGTGELVPSDHYLHNPTTQQWRLLRRIA